MSSYSFNTANGVLMVAGVEMGGFGDNKVTISRNNDVSVLVEGVDGDVCFATSNKKAGTIGFDLMHSSEYDLFMDQLTGYSGLIDVSFYDTDTGKALQSTGKVMTQPDIAINESPENRSWVIQVANVDMSLLSTQSEYSITASTVE